MTSSSGNRPSLTSVLENVFNFVFFGAGAGAITSFCSLRIGVFGVLGSSAGLFFDEGVGQSLDGFRSFSGGGAGGGLFSSSPKKFRT